MKRHRLAAIVVCALALAAPAAAQTPILQTGTWTVTPFVPVTFGGDTDSASLGVGGAVGYGITDRLGIEGEVGFAFDLAGDDEVIDWRFLTVSANALFQFPIPDSLVTPYATAGLSLGRTSVSADIEELILLEDSSTEMGFNLGGGATVGLTERIHVRGDVRYLAFSDNAPNHFRIYGGLSFRLR